MIEQTITVFQQAAPAVVCLIFAGTAIALSIWSDSDVYNEARRQELSAALVDVNNSREARRAKETRRGHQGR